MRSRGGLVAYLKAWSPMRCPSTTEASPECSSEALKHFNDIRDTIRELPIRPRHKWREYRADGDHIEVMVPSVNNPTATFTCSFDDEPLLWVMAISADIRASDALKNRGYYIKGKVPVEGMKNGITKYMHTIILPLTLGSADHMDRKRNNNRRENLRAANGTDQAVNREIPHSDGERALPPCIIYKPDGSAYQVQWTEIMTPLAKSRLWGWRRTKTVTSRFSEKVYGMKALERAMDCAMSNLITNPLYTTAFDPLTLAHAMEERGQGSFTHSLPSSRDELHALMRAWVQTLREERDELWRLAYGGKYAHLITRHEWSIDEAISSIDLMVHTTISHITGGVSASALAGKERERMRHEVEQFVALIDHAITSHYPGLALTSPSLNALPDPPREEEIELDTHTPDSLSCHEEMDETDETDETDKLSRLPHEMPQLPHVVDICPDIKGVRREPCTRPSATISGASRASPLKTALTPVSLPASVPVSAPLSTHTPRDGACSSLTSSRLSSAAGGSSLASERREESSSDSVSGMGMSGESGESETGVTSATTEISIATATTDSSSCHERRETHTSASHATASRPMTHPRVNGDTASAITSIMSALNASARNGNGNEIERISGLISSSLSGKKRLVLEPTPSHTPPLTPAATPLRDGEQGAVADTSLAMKRPMEEIDRPDVKGWMNDCLVDDPNHCVPSNSLYPSYLEWMKVNAPILSSTLHRADLRKALAKTAFAQCLLGYHLEKKSVTVWTNKRLIPHTPSLP
jgi:hypothetical protein